MPISVASPFKKPELNLDNKTLQCVLIAALCVMVCAWAWLTWLSQGYATVDLAHFYLGLVPITLIWLALLLVPEQKLLTISGYLLATALAIRAIVFFAYPILEDDHYRYLFDGYLVLNFGNPYAWVPADFFGDNTLSLSAEEWLDGVSHPDLPTVYGPVCELIFGLSYWISPSSLLPLKGFVLIADLTLLWLIKRMATPKGFYLYALCPLLLHSFNINAHSDIFAVTFLFAAFYLDKSKHRWRFAGLISCAVLAFLSKPFALIALPFLFRFNLIKWLLWTLLVAAVELPLHFSGGTQWSSVVTMGSGWYFNAGPWLLFAKLLNPSVATLVWLIGLVATFSWVFIKHHLRYQPERPRLQKITYQENTQYFRGDSVFGVFLLLGAVVNPWYFIWVLAFAALFTTYWSWIAASVLMLSYASGINLASQKLGLYDIPLSVLIAEYGIITTAIGIEWYQSCRSKAQKTKHCLPNN